MTDTSDCIENKKEGERIQNHAGTQKKTRSNN